MCVLGLSTLKQLLIPLKLEKFGLSCENALSQYGLISGMTMPILMFPSVFMNSFSNLLIPEVTEYYTQKNFTPIRKMICTIFKLVCIFSIGVMGFFILFSNEISLMIYKSLETANYLKLLAPLLPLMYLDNIIDCILKGLDGQVGVMICNVLDLIISISFICLLLPIQGILGYIIVIYISEIFNFSISLLQLKKITGFKIDFVNWILKPIIRYFFCYYYHDSFFFVYL